MKAAQYSRYGGPEVIEVSDNVPVPSVGENQVLVEVHAASPNPFDWKLRAGYMKEMIPLKFPVTIGGDFSGIVSEIGNGVSEFKTGDEVYGQALILSGGSGAFAEFATAKISNISKKPKKISFPEAAVLPLVGSSAIQALEEHIKLKKGNRILIHGGAGGIGHIAIQLAKSLGAYVTTAVSGRDMEFVKSLGVDEAIDYRKEKFEEKIHGFDAVYDTVGGETTERSFRVLKKGGTLVSMLGAPNPELAKKYGVAAIGQNTKITSERLNRLTELVEKGAIKPHIDKVFPLDQTREAFEHLEKGHPRGKVVVKIKE